MRATIILFATTIIAAPATAQPAETPADDSAKLICKKEVETGSLVRKKRRCFTQAEWNRIAEAHKQGTERLALELTAKSRTN